MKALNASTKRESVLGCMTDSDSEIYKTRGLEGKKGGAFKYLVAEAFKQPVLTQQQEMLLIRQSISGDQGAREKLIRSNLRYAVSLAHKLRGYLSDKTHVEDLFGEGVRGLVEAIERFDVQRNNRFITYAYWWMRKMMRAYIERENGATSNIAQRFEQTTVEYPSYNTMEDTLFDSQELTPETQAQKQVFLDLLQDIISGDEFSEKERICLQAMLLEGKSSGQIEHEQGIKSNTVKSHIFRAKDKLLKAFQGRGVTPELVSTLLYS